MTAHRLRETADAARSDRTTRVQPPYHSEISGEYLSALQRQVDAGKSKNFTLTPISEPGW